MTRVLKAGSLVDLLPAQDRRQVVADLEAERFEAGRSLGRTEGRAAAEVEDAALTRRALSALDQLLARQATSSADDLQARRTEVLSAALEIAEWVLHHELSSDSRSLLARLDVALEALLPDSRPTLVVAPADVELVGTWARSRDLDVVTDHALSPGEARLDSGAGQADLSVRAALAQAAQALEVPALHVVDGESDVDVEDAA